MSGNTKRPLLPRLRFPDFQEVWESLPMSVLYSFKGNNSLSRDKLNYTGGSFRNIHYGDIHTKFAQHLRADIETVPYINDDESHSTIRSENYCIAGDMVFADASEDMADIGKAIEVIDAGDVPLVSGLHTILARPNEGSFGLGFGTYLFSSEGIKKQIQRESQGAKVIGLSAARLGNVLLYYPRELGEQQKIADCLSSLDELITAEIQKLDTLKAHKKGLMQQLFPSEDETVPRLRFPEFLDAGGWAFVSLNKLARRCTQRNRNGVITRVLTNSAKYGVVDQRDYFDKDIATQGNLENYYVVEEGDYVYNPRISATAPVGPISKNNVATGVISPLYSVFRFCDDNNDFYAQYFKTTGWHQYMRQASSTGARHDRMAITNNDFMTMPLPVSTPEEQQKIADCLSSLDALITAQKQKIDALKAHKKGLMQQLFPVLDEVSA